MSNTDVVLEFLENNQPGEFCDDCISKEAAVEPRQQVNQICNRLSRQGTIIRADGTCTVCGRTKIVNTLTGRQLAPAESLRQVTTLQLAQAPTIPKEIDIERVRNEIVRICQELWMRNKTDASPPKGISAIINILKDENLIPRHQANMMLTICNLRNVHVWEQVQLGSREMAISSAAWDIVQDWWNGTRGK